MHGDFDDSHIFQDKVRFTGIIDFGEIRGSHRLYDLGHYKLHDNYGRFTSLLAGYRTVYPITEEDFIKIDYLALFMGLGRCKYKHYKKLVQRQLESMRKEHII
jgi:Ser/Thr protein kinase RdoA (MazF antagonist)